MSYRNDQDAALARADALQVELDQSRRELARTKYALARREAELADAKRGPAPPVAFVQPPPSLRPASSLHPAAAIAMAAAAFLGIAAFVTCSQAERRRAQALENHAFEESMKHADLGASTFRSCTVDTVPSGARVVAVDANGNTYPMGTTPFSRSIGSWRLSDEHLEARLDGYRSVTLTEPAMDWNTSVCGDTITLEPLSGR